MRIVHVNTIMAVNSADLLAVGKTVLNMILIIIYQGLQQSLQ